MVIFLHLGIGPDIKHFIFNQLAPNTSEKVPETFPPKIHCMAPIKPLKELS